MITVIARLLKNDITIDVNGTKYIARPSGWNFKGTYHRLKRLFTLKYEIYDSRENLTAIVVYDDIHDEILIQKGEQKWKTKSAMFSPTEFKYNEHTYMIHEKLTGLIYITCENEIVATGICGFKSVKFSKYNDELKDILPELAVGYCIKILTLDMFI